MNTPIHTASYMTKLEIRQRIASLQSEIAYLQAIQTNCANCVHWKQGGCELAGGAVPPENVQRDGCESWRWDEIPF